MCFERRDAIVHTEDREVRRDIDHLPLPARHLVPSGDLVMTDRLSSTDIEMAHVMFSRGCPYRCRFCAVAGSIMQYRSGRERKRCELEDLIARYGVGGFAVVDDNFIINRHKVREICEAIEDLGLRWSALSRVNTVQPELLGALRRSGCIELKFGMESGSATILRAMRKNITPEQIRRAVLDARRRGHQREAVLDPRLPWGEPGDDARDDRACCRSWRRRSSGPRCSGSFLCPGTEVYENPERYRLRGTHVGNGWDGDWSQFHIHHNTRHWWGEEREFAEVEAGYRELAAVVEGLWPDPHAGEGSMLEAA